MQNDPIDQMVKSNQNRYRLNSLCKLESLPTEAQSTINKLLQSPGDRAHHALGVLLWALLTKNSPVAVVSTRDLNTLIQEATVSIPEGSFSVLGHRKDTSNKKTSIWSQMTGVSLKYGIFKIIKEQKGNVPAVIELTYPKLVEMVSTKATDEIRKVIIKSTLK